MLKSPGGRQAKLVFDKCHGLRPWVSTEELKERILKGIEEINAEPVVHRWKNFDLATN